MSRSIDRLADSQMRLTLMLMGFDVPRLLFLRWLMRNGRDPEWTAVQEFAQ